MLLLAVPFALTLYRPLQPQTMDGGNFDTYFLESDDITGPWSYVTYLANFGCATAATFATAAVAAADVLAAAVAAAVTCR